MKMFSADAGLCAGVQDHRIMFTFTTREALNRFMESGWQADALVAATAKAGEKGCAAAGAIDVAPGVKLYQITENGLALKATIQCTKYWKDDELLK